MKAFIQALDIRAWRSILTSWTPPNIKDDEGKTTLKAEINWRTNDDRLANDNNKTLHAIFNGCDAEHIQLISSYEIVEEAWDIIQTTFEGSGDVKRNKLLSFITIFENLHMLEDKSLSDFYTKLCDIAK